MNLRHVEFVVAVAEERSFSRAAERAHVTQPTLSNGIALLESELGGRLFVRTTRRVDLSPFGEQVLPMIEALNRSHQELKAGARAFHDPAHRMIRIGLSPLVDVRRVTEILAPYTRANPGCQAFFKECFLGDLDLRLNGAQMDLVVRPWQGRATPSRSAIVLPLYAEELFYLSRRSLTGPAVSGDAVMLKDIADDVFVLGPDGCGLAAFTRHLFKTGGLRLKEYRGEALSYQVMQEWADIGIGSTILPASKIAPEFRARAQPLVSRAKQPLSIGFEALWMRSAAYPRHVVELHEHFQDAARTMAKDRKARTDRVSRPARAARAASGA